MATRPKNAFYAQSGGVTAVINASAAGVIETARKHKSRIGKVLAGRNGIIGALNEDLIDTSRESPAAIRALMHTPGGAFGSCRYKLKGVEKGGHEYERLLEVFRAHDIGYFFYNGGNDSADTCLKVSRIAAETGEVSPGVVEAVAVVGDQEGEKDRQQLAAQQRRQPPDSCRHSMGPALASREPPARDHPDRGRDHQHDDERQ